MELIGYLISVSAFLLIHLGVPQVFAEDPMVIFTVEEGISADLEVGSLGDDDVLPLGLDPEVRVALKYSLLPKGYPRSSLFRVAEDSGQIFTREKLDREALCGYDPECDLDIQVAVQSAISQFFKKVKVTIRVTDINDNDPTFPRKSISLSMLENVAVGSAFPLEEAEDLDLGINGVQVYEFLPSSSGSEDFFSVNLTKSDVGRNVVNLVIRQALDREARPLHVLTLVAKDGGKPPLTGTVNIRVTVEDVNDNAPAFGQPSYNVSLPETAKIGTSVVRVTATDDDTDKYGVKEFRFDPQDADDVARFFAIDPITGMVTVAGSLLERQGKTLRLLVECLDKGVPPLVSRAEIDVTVKDTVNSAPIISNNVMFRGSVSERAQSGTVVAVFEVEDRDAGLNGIVSCSIVSDAFELQPLAVDEYKVIVVRRLDRESEPVHNVTIQCDDAGSPAMSDSVTFMVKVKDENDEAPQFSQLLYEKTLAENTRPNQVLLRVSATDLDIGENARISYALVDADPILRVDTRGNIIATRSLDYEDHRQLKFKVMATDHGDTPKSNTADVIITIEDLNDEIPKFVKHRYEFHVKENEKADTVVNASPLVAKDRDTGINGKISYKLLPTVSPFTIRPDGVILTREPLNREQRPQYTLTVEAVDAGIPQQTGAATVVIRVIDQNDHAPRIIYPKNGNSTVALAFDARPRSVVLSVLAEDEDEGLNKELDFHLASGSGRGIFDLNSSSGELVLSRALGVKDIGPHRLTIVVKDRSPMFPLASNSTFEVVVYAPNASDPAEQDRDREREHVMVVIILGVVTGAVTVAVIITIAVIRRTDSQRRKYLEGRAKMAPEVERLESGKMSVGYVISNGAQDGNSMRAPGNKDGSDGHKGDTSKDVTHDEGFADKSFNTSQGSSGVADNSEWSKALRVHQDLLKLHGVDPAFLAHGSVGDDVISDGSAESTTCDSGRGGSEEDNGSHGRASPVQKDMVGMNNLSHPHRPVRPSKPPRTVTGTIAETKLNTAHNPQRPFASNLQPSGGLPVLSGRQLAHSLDAPCLEPLKQYNNSRNNINNNNHQRQQHQQYQPPARSLSAPPVKHVSFSDDPHNSSTISINRQHVWPELLPPHPRGMTTFSSPMSPLEEGGGVMSPEGRYGPASSISQRGAGIGSVTPRRQAPSPLNLNIDRSFDTLDDGNSTTTSGSYTVDDLSPRTLSVDVKYMPEQAVV